MRVIITSQRLKMVKIEVGLNFTADERREVVFNKKDYPTLFDINEKQKSYKKEQRKLEKERELRKLENGENGKDLH